MEKVINKQKLIAWFKKFGVAGLIFFVVKGLVWLIVLYVLVK